MRQKRALAALLAAGMLACIVLGSGFSPASGGQSFFQREKAGADYETFENPWVLFTVDYPAGYEIAQPYENLVYFTGGDSFQATAEYAYYTVNSDSFIYSAGDFAWLLGQNGKLLGDWLGTDAFVLDWSGPVTVGDKAGYLFAVSLGGSYTGRLYLFDGQGAFGCYCLQFAWDSASPDAALYAEQADHMVESFSVTGAYQAEGYTVYASEDLDAQFMVRDAAMGQMEDTGELAAVYPVEGEISHSCIIIDELTYPESEDAASVLEQLCAFYLENRDRARYTTQTASFDLGRYLYTTVAMEYYENGTHFTVDQYVFVKDGRYWQVRSTYTDEYANVTYTALSDILFSLRFGGEPL